MPGSVSDAYDPEFGTAANAALVAGAIGEMAQRVTDIIGSDKLQNIVDLCHKPPINREQRMFQGCFTEREWRIIRFALNRAKESV